MYDHVKHVISLNGERVGRMTLVGFAVERFLMFAICNRIGFHSLRPGLVSQVGVRDCIVNGTKMKGEIQIFVAEEASNLAMRVACRVAQDLEASGFRLLDAVSPQFDVTRKKVGEHDIVAERRVRCGGYTSVELKLRVITHPKKTLRDCVRSSFAMKLLQKASFGRRVVSTQLQVNQLEMDILLRNGQSAWYSWCSSAAPTHSHGAK